MKKIIFSLILLILGMFSYVKANEVELPSETGVVKNIEYSDEKNQDNTIHQLVTVKITSGQFKGEERIIENILSDNSLYNISVKKGDRVVLHVDKKSDDIITVDDLNFYIADIERDYVLIGISIVFIALLLAIGRKKGVFSLVSIIATVGLIFFMLKPMILNGFCPIASSVLIGILSTIITIYLVGGFNTKSSSAVIGTSVSLIFAGGMSMLAIYFAHLTGFSGEETAFLYSAHPEIDFTGLLAASIIIASLGALMDTGVSIASSINEIHLTDSSLSVKELFTSGMNIGKDIIGTMSNTLILVYLGSALPLVLLSDNIDLQKFFNLNQVATEISSALIGSISILICVPLTAIISSYLCKKQKIDEDFDFSKDN